MKERPIKRGTISIAEKILGGKDAGNVSIILETDKSPDMISIGKGVFNEKENKEVNKNSPTTYQEKLQSPKWQKLRLRVFNRDKFICQLCGDEETQLQVHHLAYSKTGNPWDVQEKDLITLCKHCHHEVEYRKKHGNPNAIKEGVFIKTINEHKERFSFYITIDRISLNIWSESNELINGTCIRDKNLNRLKNLINNNS